MQAMLALAMGTALVGTDVGWQPIDGGGLEYIVQIEPEALARLKPGDELAHDIRPVLRDVRRYRIVIGKGPLPRIALPERPATPPGSIQPRSAPAPVAATQPQRSIVIPPERNIQPPTSPLAVAPRAVAPAPVGAPTALPPRVAAIPLAPRTTPGVTPPAAGARVVAPFDAAPPTAVSAPPAKATLLAPPPTGRWQASPPPVAPALAPAAAPAAAPIILPSTKAAAPTVAPAPAAIPVPAVPAGDAKNGPWPANDGQRYRYGGAAGNPPARYGDVTLPPVVAPPLAPLATPPVEKSAMPPAEKKADIPLDKSSKLEIGKGPAFKAPAPEVAGPLLTVPAPEAAPLKLKTAAKSLSVESQVPDLAVPAVGSRLIADTFDQKPAPLLTDPAVRPASIEPPPIVAVAATPPAEAATPAAPDSETAGAAAPSRPWWALTLTLLALFASLGGNVFLGWVAHDARSRYGAIMRETGRIPAA